MEKKIFGYIRVSTKEQKVDRQIDELAMFIDYASGKDFERTEYLRMKSMVRDEDVIYVRSIDRLGRNKQLIKEELDFYRKKNVRVKILDIPTTMMEPGEGQSDILIMITNILIEVLGTIAQRERETTLERQREGIAAAKRRGQRFGRPPFVFPDNWETVSRHYLRGHVRAGEAIRLLGMKKSTFNIPVGTVMAWPSEKGPKSGGKWLECNGQTIPSKYKRLRELIGDKTPNYQGMFLRGYGSQTASTSQGLTYGNRRQRYSSGELNEIQNDTTRMVGNNLGTIMLLNQYWYNRTRSARYSAVDHNYRLTDDETVQNPDGSLFSQAGGWGVWREDTGGDYYFLRESPKKYRLTGNKDSGYSLQEYDDSGSALKVWGKIGDYAFNSMISTPVSGENRPINVAVRYFIKAF